MKKATAEYEYFDVAYNKLVKLSADEIKRAQYENRERNPALRGEGPGIVSFSLRRGTFTWDVPLSFAEHMTVYG